MINQDNLDFEPEFRRIVRLSVGAVLIMKALVMLCLAFMLSIFGPLIGGLSMASGAGGASDEQISTGWRWIGLMVATPYIATALLMIAGIRLLRDFRRNFVAIACGFVGIIEIGLLYTLKDSDSSALVVLMIVLISTNVIGVVVGIWMKPWRGNSE